MQPVSPRWLVLLRSLLFSGIYTIDNMDFVLRDAYMSGYSPRAFDLDRLLHYSFFTPQGLTIHDRGADALVRFIGVRAELFRSVYFHRTVRAIDLTLKDLFAASRDWLFPGNPLEHLDDYLHFTESSLLVDVQRWATSQPIPPAARSASAVREPRRPQDPLDGGLHAEPRLRARTIPNRRASSAMPASSSTSCGNCCRRICDDLPLRVDIARTIFRPHTAGPAGGQNFLCTTRRRSSFSPLSANDVLPPPADQPPPLPRLCPQQRARRPRSPPPSITLLGGAVDDVTNM